MSILLYGVDKLDVDKIISVYNDSDLKAFTQFLGKIKLGPTKEMKKEIKEKLGLPIGIQILLDPKTNEPLQKKPSSSVHLYFNLDWNPQIDEREDKFEELTVSLIQKRDQEEKRIQELNDSANKNNETHSIQNWADMDNPDLFVSIILNEPPDESEKSYDPNLRNRSRISNAPYFDPQDDVRESNCSNFKDTNTGITSCQDNDIIQLDGVTSIPIQKICPLHICFFSLKIKKKKSRKENDEWLTNEEINDLRILPCWIDFINLKLATGEVMDKRCYNYISNVMTANCKSFQTDLAPIVYRVETMGENVLKMYQEFEGKTILIPQFLLTQTIIERYEKDSVIIKITLKQGNRNGAMDVTKYVKVNGDGKAILLCAFSLYSVQKVTFSKGTGPHEISLVYRDAALYNNTINRR